MPTIKTKARIIETIARTSNVRSVVFEPEQSVDYKAGQYMVVAPDDFDIKKPLSISSSPSRPGRMEFTKKITDSPFSQKIASLKAGETLTVTYPLGAFTLAPDVKKYCFLSGGIGITPIISMCTFAVDRGLDVEILLLYGNRTGRDIAFRAELEALAQKTKNFRLVHILSETDPDWKGRTGFITAALVRELLPDFKDWRFYTCGPPPMVAKMQALVTEELALSEEALVTEQFMGY